MSIIGLSGTHGTGKTTLLDSVIEIRPSIHTHRASLSRQVQEKLGWPNLSYVSHSAENVMLLQSSILKALIERDANAPQDSVALFDRTPVDVWAYTRQWLEPYLDLPGVKSWFEIHTTQCVHAMEAYKAIVFLAIHPGVPFKPDPRRAPELTRASHELLCYQFLDYYYGKPYTVINSDSLDWRSLCILNLVDEQ